MSGEVGEVGEIGEVGEVAEGRRARAPAGAPERVPLPRAGRRQRPSPAPERPAAVAPGAPGGEYRLPAPSRPCPYPKKTAP